MLKTIDTKRLAFYYFYMKKFLLTLPTPVFPYFLLFELFCLFTGFLMEELFDSFFLVMIFYILLFGVVAFAFDLVFYFLSKKRGWKSKDTALINMIVKLAQMSAYIAIFVIGVLCLLTVFTMLFPPAFFIFDLVSVFLSGINGLTAALFLSAVIGLLKKPKTGKTESRRLCSVCLLRAIYFKDRIFY